MDTSDSNNSNNNNSVWVCVCAYAIRQYDLLVKKYRRPAWAAVAATAAADGQQKQHFRIISRKL